MENFQESRPFFDKTPQLLKERYKIDRKIGEGGFAETYLGYDNQTGTPCVLKILSWKDVPDWKVIELFEREARVLSQMDHPQIPKFIEFFTEDSPPETKIVLVQEYVPGRNLAQSIADGRHYTEKEVIQIGLEVAKILEYLQKFSPPIIHRDIKPSNLLRSDEGTIHLIDFGAVRDKVLHHQKTEAGGFTVVGTYGFMPFEQFQGQAIPASDIYSLGVTLISLLSHKEPHEMESTGSSLNFEPHVNVSSGFKAVLQKMIAHRPEDRYALAEQLRHDLEALLAGEQPLAVQKTAKRKFFSSGTFVLILLIFFVGWFAYVRKPVAPRPRPAAVSNIKQQPALQPPYTGKVVTGTIFFDNKPISHVTDVHPTFWFRDESKGIAVTAQTRYSNGEFVIRGLPPGTYGVQINFDSNQLNRSSFPGDYRAWKTFSVVSDANTVMHVEVQKLIHMRKPENNALELQNWNRCCEEKKPSHRGPLTLEWNRVLEKDVYYDYSIARVQCPYKTVGSAASGTTTQTKLKIDLPPNEPNEYYILTMEARKDGRSVGSLMTHGANGLGWDYRFRID